MLVQAPSNSVVGLGTTNREGNEADKPKKAKTVKKAYHTIERGLSTLTEVLEPPQELRLAATSTRPMSGSRNAIGCKLL